MSDTEPPSFFRQQLAVLITEWGFVDANIGRLDTIVFVIRGWAVTLTTAIIGFALSKDEPKFLVIALVPIILLWVTDALFKSFQRNFISRSLEIERYLQSDQFKMDFEENSYVVGITIPNTAGRFGTGNFFSRTASILREMVVRNTLLAYSMQLFLLLLARFYLC